MIETNVNLKGTRRQSTSNFPRELYNAQIVMHSNALQYNNFIIK